jgi:beta-mannosidase
MRIDAMTVGGFLLGLALAAAADVAGAARRSVPLHEGWTFRQVGREEAYPARVPGVVHLDLLANGLIGDPFFGRNEQDLQWIGKTDWEYRTRFAVSPELRSRRHVDLVFEGLDTYARVYLNGEQVIDADNMYRQWRVGVAKRLRDDGNELRVELRSPIREDLEKVTARGYELPAVNDQGEKTSVYVRKAPYSFGWDWGPRFVTCGIWKPVRLEAWDDARLADVFVRQTELGEERARLVADVDVLGDGAAAGSSASLEVSVAGPEYSGPLPLRGEGQGGGSVNDRVAGPEYSGPLPLRGEGTIPLEEGTRTHSAELEIRHPRRWWPNGYGEQPLYTVTTRLVIGGEPVDEVSTRIGLRTLELRRAPDEWGKSFEFVVNGVPVFAKGANWIPADSFLPRLTRERYARLLGSAHDAHMNMLRVWGGGIYESDDFYDLADELGLLVWQDFHFSCSLYPADPPFLANVAIEAEEAIRRLRNHPSVALWNGNNEIESAWLQWGWRERLPRWLWSDYEKIFHQLLPNTVAQLDPTRAYWPSSPSANRESMPGDPGNGDMHYWGVWHGGKPFATYEATPARFMSEYGFQSFPEMATIRSFADPDDLAIDSPVMTSHQKHPRGDSLIREYMLRDYREPKDFASFLYVSQVLQAEGVKIGAEYHRRSRPRTMGSLYWQLDDCWPVASWSSIDYFGRWKALQYYARRFFAPLLASTAEEEGEVSVFVVSDRKDPVSGTLETRLLDLDGRVLWERSESLTVPPLSSRRALGIEKAALLERRDPNGVFLHVRLVGDGRLLSENTRFFVPMKDLALRRPTIDVEVVAAAEEGIKVTLRSDTLARSVRLGYGADAGAFSDNYFDVIPGRPVEVFYRPAGAVDPEALHRGLEILTLADAF